MNTAEVEHKLREVGYESRRPEVLALAGAVEPPRVILCEGPPGCGKTSLAECWAKAVSAQFVYALLHCWSDDQELCCGVDVAAAVEGAADRVRQDGVLAVAARASQNREVVLCLDELDKCQDRTEALLLDFLQTGRVPVRPGEHVQANLHRMLVVITSNGQRELSDALLRRCRRVRMHPLPVAVLDRIVRERTSGGAGIVVLASKAARAIAEKEGVQLSMQELCAFVRDIPLCDSIEDLREILAQHAARHQRGAEHALKCDISHLWGEIVASRRRCA